MSTDQQIEQEIHAKAADRAPRITSDDVEAAVDSTWYINGATGVVPDDFQPPVAAGSPLQLLTICVLVLKNGFTVTGESAVVSAANFDAGIGRKVARANAMQKIWPLLGFRLRDQIAMDEYMTSPTGRGPL